MYNKFFQNLSLGLICFLGVNSLQAVSAEDMNKPSTSRNEATKRVLSWAKGHQQFLQLNYKQNEKEFVRLVTEGQAPRTLFIGCSDSRVVPELITSKNPGQLFVIRNAGNFVPTNDPQIPWDGIAGTIQFAVEYLKVSDIIVCGHSQCGAIQGTFAEKGSLGLNSLEKWLRWGREAKDATLQSLGQNASDQEKFAAAERISVLYQLEHLLTYPYIKQLVESDKIHLHGWHFTINTGEIEFYDPSANNFVSLRSVMNDNTSR